MQYVDSVHTMKPINSTSTTTTSHGCSKTLLRVLLERGSLSCWNIADWGGRQATSYNMFCVFITHCRLKA